jgi:hypothetical protein
MNRWLFALLLSLFALPSGAQEAVPAELARRRVLEAARRLGADGWHERSQEWRGVVDPAKPPLLEFWLAPKTDYLLIFAARPHPTRHRLEIYDRAGQPLRGTTFIAEGGTQALLLTPAQGGRHFLRLQPLTLGATPTQAALTLLSRPAR